MTIAILATGDEITHGDTLNTNARTFASMLSDLGYSMGMHVSCGDKHEEIQTALAFCAQHHAVVILSGGLGPTSDDRTRFVLADYLALPLITDEGALVHIESRLHQAGLQCDAGQEVQAQFPKGAVIFPNPNGTACGCALETDTHVFVMLPGPPKECLPMFETAVLPYLKPRMTVSKKICQKWVFQNVPEGRTAQAVEAALQTISCDVGYRLMKPDLEVKVRSLPSAAEAVKQAMDHLWDQYHVSSER